MDVPQPTGAARSLVDVAREVLEPVVVARGFAGASVGLGGDGSVSIMYCAPAAELARRWQRACSLILGVDPDPHMCVDLMIEASSDGVLQRVDLEATDLGEQVDAVGGDGRGLALAELRAVDHRTAVARISGAMDVLFPLPCRR